MVVLSRVMTRVPVASCERRACGTAASHRGALLAGSAYDACRLAFSLQIHRVVEP